MNGLKLKAEEANLTDFNTFFDEAKVQLIKVINERDRFDKLMTGIANYLAIKPSRFNLRDTFVTLAEFGHHVDKTYDEYQRILRLKMRNKDVLYERLKATRITKIENPDMNKLENLLADLQAPALSRKPGMLLFVRFSVRRISVRREYYHSAFKSNHYQNFQ